MGESGVNLAMIRMYARALKGKRARGEKPQKRGGNISLISALFLEKVVASRNIYRTVYGVTFEAFMVRELVPKLWKNACVVMDNAKFHQGEIVRELIEKAGAKLIYLSPYSPEFSPSENFWSKVKAIPSRIWKMLERSYISNNHKLVELAENVKKVLTKAFPDDQGLHKVIADIVCTAKEFSDIDPDSYYYRYPISTEGNYSTRPKQIVNLSSMATHMDNLLEALDTINFGLNVETDIAKKFMRHI